MKGIEEMTSTFNLTEVYAYLISIAFQRFSCLQDDLHENTDFEYNLT